MSAYVMSFNKQYDYEDMNIPHYIIVYIWNISH